MIKNCVFHFILPNNTAEKSLKIIFKDLPSALTAACFSNVGFDFVFKECFLPAEAFGVASPFILSCLADEARFCGS